MLKCAADGRGRRPVSLAPTATGETTPPSRVLLPATHFIIHEIWQIISNGKYSKIAKVATMEGGVGEGRWAS